MENETTEQKPKPPVLDIRQRALAELERQRREERESIERRMDGLKGDD